MQYQRVLTEFVAEFDYLKICGHRQFLIDRRASVHPVFGAAQYCMEPNVP